MWWTCNRLRSIIDRNEYGSNDFRSLPEDDTYEVISSKPKIGIGIIPWIEPSREYGGKIVFKWDILRIEQFEAHGKHSHEQEHSEKESA